MTAEERAGLVAIDLPGDLSRVGALGDAVRLIASAIRSAESEARREALLEALELRSDAEAAINEAIKRDVAQALGALRNSVEEFANELEGKAEDWEEEAKTAPSPELVASRTARVLTYREVAEELHAIAKSERSLAQNGGDRP